MMPQEAACEADDRLSRHVLQQDERDNSSSLDDYTVHLIEEKKSEGGGSPMSNYPQQQDTHSSKRMPHNNDTMTTHPPPPPRIDNKGREVQIMEAILNSNPPTIVAGNSLPSKGGSSKRQVDEPMPPCSSNSLGNTSTNSNKGLHHRHHNHHHPNQSPRTSKQVHPFSTHASPRRRKHLHDSKPNRKRKWTVVYVVRILMLAGIILYFFMMVRVIRHSGPLEEKTGYQDTLRGRLSQLLNSNNDNDGAGQRLVIGKDGNYYYHQERGGYLRSNSMPLPFLGEDFIRRRPLEDPATLQRRLNKRAEERRKRTTPPMAIQANDIAPYQVLVSMDQQQQQQELQHLSNGADNEDSSLATFADPSEICGINAQEASKHNPQSFLKRDVLNSNSKVLITGILSNPVAFHLALTLKAHCGVEVMVGIDPMLPNTISNRLKLVEQMKILTTNAPKMIQPILVPMLGLDPRVKKSKKDSPSEHPVMLSTTGELNLLNFKPTHIVHLSTSTPNRNPPEEVPPPAVYRPKRPLSPYQISEDDPYEPSLFSIRSSLTAMEQILASIVSSSEDKSGEPPHLTYASATRTNSFGPRSNEHKIHANTKLMDEILADTYHSLFGVHSIGLRFPPNSIYGPWDEPGADIYQLMEAALQGNTTFHKDRIAAQEFLYAQDAVDAIITAMQFRPKKSVTFDLKTNTEAALSEVSSMVHSFLGTSNSAAGNSVALENNGNAGDMQLHDSPTGQSLAWFPRTSLRDGILRSLAWHMDRAQPYGPPITNSNTKEQKDLPSRSATAGDALLLRNSVPTCAADDLACHSGSTYLPCLSECSTKDQCKASIFDPVRELSRNMTEGCDAVLYTQSLGLDVEDMKLQSQFEDDVEPIICNLAYVARTSPLVRAVIEKIPPDELVRLGVPEASEFDEKVQKLNGRLLYRGWILIWVNAGASVSTEDSSLLKISPGRMFSSDVLYSVFVEENFSVSPTTDDVRFLIGQMDRGATKQRSIYRWVRADEKSKPKKAKFTIPASPEKRASILVSQLKFKISDKGRLPQDTKISIMDAVRFMRFEIGNDPTKQKESFAIKRQTEFYRRIPSFVNSKDLRDSLAPLYKYEIKHWIRTRWVVHDLKLEESRQLRCDWYHEHVQWGSEIDQLGFAAVMAQREVERRVAHWEPDDRVKAKQPETPAVVRDVTDFNEWFAMDTELNKLQYLEVEQSAEVEQVPDHIVRDAVDEDGTEEDSAAADELPAQPAEKKEETGLYVRIISDRIMSLSRKAWQAYRSEMAGSAAQK